MSAPEIDDGEEEGEFAAFQTDTGDIVIYDVRPGEDTEASGAWIRIHPDDCVDLTEAQ
ncbi:hypothetical protein [Halomarina litorea]|uniref:hypothetical protein n=1 Tax=Halomarina litorea TaxID=2961595 RepID=UPI0020C42268|nr:hypothetical protein [Halomarina sp. BCD28]